MITTREIADKTMTEEKRATAKLDLVAFYIGRPLSYYLTIPFLYTSISPNAISLMSIIPILIGFLLSCFLMSKTGMILSWCMFFLWNLLDGVDGNVARYKHQFSKFGSVYDAMAGYLAAALTFFSAGIMAAHSTGILSSFIVIPREGLLIVGGLSALINMFPRLIMHKAATTIGDIESVREISDKKEYSLLKVIALNLKSCTGGAQVLFLISILTNALDVFTLFYFLFNSAVMLLSLRSIFKEK